MGSGGGFPGFSGVERCSGQHGAAPRGRFVPAAAAGLAQRQPLCFGGGGTLARVGASAGHAGHPAHPWATQPARPLPRLWGRGSSCQHGGAGGSSHGGCQSHAARGDVRVPRGELGRAVRGSGAANLSNNREIPIYKAGAHPPGASCSHGAVGSALPSRSGRPAMCHVGSRSLHPGGSPASPWRGVGCRRSPCNAGKIKK